MMFTKKITYPKGTIVVVLESHVTAENETLRAGDRVRSDHPSVLRNPQMFHADSGMTTAEIQELHQQRFDIQNLLAQKERT